MHHFDIDWAAFLDALPAWEKLPHDVRRIALETIKPSQPVRADRLGTTTTEALRAAGLTRPTSGTSITIADEYRPMWRALRAMSRHHFFDADVERQSAGEQPPGGPSASIGRPGSTMRDLGYAMGGSAYTANETALATYIQDQFTAEEVRALLQAGTPGDAYLYDYYGPANRVELARLVSSGEWVERFLETPSTRFSDALVFETLIALVRALLAAPGGHPLRELQSLLPGVDRAIVGAALFGGLFDLLTFATLRSTDLEPVIGVWPGVVTWFQRPPAVAPEPMVPDEQYHAAVLMEDMSTVLAAAASEPLRLRGNDYALFARNVEELRSRLVTVPGWTSETLHIGPAERIAVARLALHALKFVDEQGTPGKTLHLVATRKGAEWLALPSDERLRVLLDHLRKPMHPNTPSWYSYEGDFEFLPVAVAFPLPQEIDLRRAVTDAFLTLATDVFVPAEQFIDFHARVANPFLALAPTERRATGYAFGRVPRSEDWEQIWRAILIAFLQYRLVALGGTRVGRTANGIGAFAITDIGRYLLGATEQFAYETDEETRIVVQPNFDIVFLAPSPKAEAEIARVADRTGHRVGVMFKLTRASILKVAEAGASAKQVIGLLRETSSKPLPENVERQIEGWFDTVRRVSVRRSMLIECPDAETAARVLSAGGKQMRKITDTVIELRDGTGKAQAALQKKLRGAGVFVER